MTFKALFVLVFIGIMADSYYMPKALRLAAHSFPLHRSV